MKILKRFVTSCLCLPFESKSAHLDNFLIAKLNRLFFFLALNFSPQQPWQCWAVHLLVSLLASSQCPTPSQSLPLSPTHPHLSLTYEASLEIFNLFLSSLHCLSVFWKSTVCCNSSVLCLKCYLPTFLALHYRESGISLIYCKSVFLC